jgi:hypothetical protein
MTLGGAKPQIFTLASAAGAKHMTLGGAKPQIFTLASAAGAKHLATSGQGAAPAVPC